MRKSDNELLRLPPVELVAINRRQQEVIDKLEKRVAALEAALRERIDAIYDRHEWHLIKTCVRLATFMKPSVR